MKPLQTFILCLGLALSFSLHAQLPEGRTTSTIIADALAQLPADTPQKYQQIIGDLVSTGEDGLLGLIGQMNPPGEKSNAVLEYAISGWTHFVANDPDKRALTARAFDKALNKPNDKEIQAFVIRQLRTIAADENIPTLSEFLNNPYLCDPAAQALVSIGTEKSGAALLEALKSSVGFQHLIQALSPSSQASQVDTYNEQILSSLINALGEAAYSPAEPFLLEMLKANPEDSIKKVLYAALGNVGTQKSLSVLKKAAEETQFAYSKDNPGSAYMALLKRLNDSDPKLVKKAAEKLLAFGKEADRQDIRVAAARLLLSQPSVKKENILKDAIKDGNLSYLTAILNSYPFQKDKKSTELVLKTLSTATSPDAQTALSYWSAANQIEASVPEIAKLTDSANPVVQKAATLSLAKLGGEKSLVALAALLQSDNAETVTLAKNALSTYKGDLSYTLASVFDKSGDAGKMAILELISQRKMTSQYNLVYNQMFSDNATVKEAAAGTLKNVATESNLKDLFTLLERSGASLVPAIQEAINSALDNLPAAGQVQVVKEQMNRSSKKHLYYTALANSGSKEALEEITTAYANADGEEKEAAFNALSGWKSFEVIYPMLTIARDSKDKNELAKLTDALISVIRGSGQTGAIRYLYLRDVLAFAQNDNQKNEILKLMGQTGQYQAMLFVVPYMDQPATSEMAAQAAMNIALNNPAFAGTETTAILKKVSKTLSNPDADYQRQSIDKYLNENPTEGGFVSIFNGKNLDGWKGLVENPIKRAKMTKKELATAQAKADKEMANDWKVADGNIIFDGKGYNNLCTDKQYGDFEMLIDWKLYPGPEPDAGIYLRGTPQVQIWDTARVNVGAQVGSGGLYNNQQNLGKPLKVADQKVGEWNTFRIVMLGERVSVWLNGELVTDNVILENYWDRNLPIFPKEQIELQAHGSKVAYRDIYIREIPRPEPFKLSAEEEKEGFHILFDGTDLDQWTGNKRDYTVESGNIVLYPSQSFGGNLYTSEEFDNFVLRFEFMLTPGANNGLGIRTPTEGDAAYVGMELQILDNEAPVYAKLAPYQYHGSVYGVIPSKRGYLKPTGEWNYQEVIADGDHIKVILNGTTILDGNIREASKNGTMDKKSHPGLLNKSGHIGFLGHGSLVKFRNIRIKELK